MKRIGFLCLMGFLAVNVFADAKGDEIAHKYFDQKLPKDTTSIATMDIKDRSGVTKTRKLKMVMKDSPEGRKAFVEFVQPADVNGTKFLTISHRGAENDQRLYLPGSEEDPQDFQLQQGR